MTETPGKQAGADAPELEELARRLLDLWQDQLTAVAANPDIATQAARLMAAMPLPGMWLSQLGQMGSPIPGQEMDMTKIWAKMAQDWMAQDWFKGGHPNAGNGKPAAAAESASAEAGAKTAAAASGPGGRDLDELSRRLAGIEQRLGELAQQQSGARPKPAAKPKTARKPRAARAPDPKDGSGGADGGPAD